MRSSELAKMAGVSVRTLRHYHAIGLLAEPERSQNGYRDYGAEHLLRVLRIRQLATLGFSLDKIGPMIDELDAKRKSQQDGVGTADRLLEDLDRQLAKQISQLQHQRQLIAHIRQDRIAPDYPDRAKSVLQAIQSFERDAGEFGFLLGALNEDEMLAMGIAAHLYTDGELAEIERTFRAISARGLIQEYVHVSRLMESLPADATAVEREEAIRAGLAFLDKISDCFDPQNWLRPGKDYELMLEDMATAHYNGAQVAVSDELFLRFMQSQCGIWGRAANPT